MSRQLEGNTMRGPTDTRKKRKIPKRAMGLLSMAIVAAVALLAAPEASAHGSESRYIHRDGAPVVRIAVSTPVIHGSIVLFGTPRFVAAPRPVIVARRPAAVPYRAYGTIDFDVDPENARIWVDGTYRGTADDFDGYPRTMALPAGRHTVTIRTRSGGIWSRAVTVLPGRELELDFDLGRR
jgi:hypothetical protein